MEIKPLGDRGLLINFEQVIQEDVNLKVIALKEAIESSELTGINFLIPAYCSLVVGFDPGTINYWKLRDHLTALQERDFQQSPVDSRKLSIPVCYDMEYGIDLEEIANQTRLEIPEIISLHSSVVFQVFMLGFLPGFAYLGPLPQELYCRRKDTPRARVPANSVAIAGAQTGIYPTQAPGGWQILGRTPIPSFRGTAERPFTYTPGDRLRFYPISQVEFEELSANIGSGDFNWNSLNE